MRLHGLLKSELELQKTGCQPGNPVTAHDAWVDHRLVGERSYPVLSLGRSCGQSGKDIFMNPSRLLGALVLAALISAPSLAVAQPYGNYGNNGNGSGNNRSGQVTGIIQSVQGSSFTLDNGRTVFLTQGTVLSPTGLRLQSGMQVTVTGVWPGNGAINASEVANFGNNGNYNYGNNGNGNGY